MLTTWGDEYFLKALKNKNNNGTFTTGLFWGLNGLIYVRCFRQCLTTVCT